MKFYPIVRPFLFTIDAEKAHTLSLKTLKILDQANLLSNSTTKINATSTRVMGINFPNKIGLAAGLDKDGEYIDCLAKFGFGHIEVGTVTPKAQTGNPKPRLFRLPKAQAIINRMGFNNKGVDNLIQQIKQSDYKGVLGINIGKNASTPLEKASEDYTLCLEKVYPFASYITVNISSPNTMDLRNLQQGEYLEQLLKILKQQQQKLADRYQKYVPLVIKIAPDLTFEEIDMMCESLLVMKIDGVIATNTTVSREGIHHLKYADEKGGLSGEPLFERSTDALKEFHRHLKKDIPLIASGGVVSALHASEKLKAGAQLVQIYTGFIYKGPAIVGECLNALQS